MIKHVNKINRIIQIAALIIGLTIYTLCLSPTVDEIALNMIYLTALVGCIVILLLLCRYLKSAAVFIHILYLSLGIAVYYTTSTLGIVVFSICVGIAIILTSILMEEQNDNSRN